MIKPSSPSPATLVAPRPAAAAESEPRAEARDGEKSAFADVLGAQGPRADDEPSSDTARSVDDSRDSEEGAKAASEGAPAGASPSPASTDSSSATVDAMINLCTSQAGDVQGSAAPLEVDAPVACRPGSVQVADFAAAVVPEADVPHATRALFDGELQRRLALGSTLAMAQASGVASPIEPGARSIAEDLAAGVPTGVSPTGGPSEVRGTGRPSPVQTLNPLPQPPDMHSQLGTDAWADELGARVTWMVDRGDQVASLRLSPENLGPLEVRIAVREGETSVWFGAANADTRAALEQSLPRLREMLGASGLSLADAGVFSHTPRDPQRGFTTAALARASQESGAEPAAGIVMQISRRGLVDLYA